MKTVDVLADASFSPVPLSARLRGVEGPVRFRVTGRGVPLRAALAFRRSVIDRAGEVILSGHVDLAAAIVVSSPWRRVFAEPGTAIDLRFPADHGESLDGWESLGHAAAAFASRRGTFAQAYHRLAAGFVGDALAARELGFLDGLVAAPTPAPTPAPVATAPTPAGSPAPAALPTAPAVPAPGTPAPRVPEPTGRARMIAAIEKELAGK